MGSDTNPLHQTPHSSDAESSSDHKDSFLQDCLAELPSQPRASGPVASESVASDPLQNEPHSDSSQSNHPKRVEAVTDSPKSVTSTRDVQHVHLATSTFLSLVMVLTLLLLARLLVPSLVESIRYGWYRGQLRAEYELSGERLRGVSLDSLADVSQLVSQRMGPSVVHISLFRDPKSLSSAERALLGDQSGTRYQGQGSGFVIDSRGYVLTNYHVLEGSGSVEVTLSDGRKLDATIVGSDPHTDLSVLKVEANDLMPIEWGTSDEVTVGTPVWAVGSPFGLQQTVTFGIISGKHRVDFRGTRDAGGVHGGTPYGDLMQSDVALNPGNSGGPLVNSLGQVVGVNAAILGDTFRGVSFSIPSRVAQRVAKHLIEEGEVPRGWLGVELAELPPEQKFAEGGKPKPGVRVRRFPANFASPARLAGIEIGDVIVAFEGQPVMDIASLIRMIGESPVGSTVTLDIERRVGSSRSGVLDEVLQALQGKDADVDADVDDGEALTSVDEPEQFEALQLQVKLDRRNAAL